MGFFDIFKKKNNKKVVEESTPIVIENEYRTKENHFNYMYAPSTNPYGGVSGYIFFNILNEVELAENQKFYVCNLEYGHNGPALITDMADDEFLGYKKVIVGLDKERMNNDEKYTEFVLKQLLEKNRILKLHDIAFDKVVGTTSGNYVGTVVDGEYGLSILMDEEIMKKVASSPEFAAIYANVKRINDELNAIYKKYNNNNYSNDTQDLSQIEEVQEEQEEKTRRI